MLRRSDGAVAAEFALIVPVLLLSVFAVIEFGRVMWMRNALQYAVEDAARCYALDRPACDTEAKVNDYAASVAMGVAVDSSVFTSSVAASGCGKEVRANYDFTSIVPIVPLSFTLNARACRATPP